MPFERGSGFGAGAFRRESEMGRYVARTDLICQPDHTPCAFGGCIRQLPHLRRASRQKSDIEGISLFTTHSRVERRRLFQEWSAWVDAPDFDIGRLAMETITVPSETVLPDNASGENLFCLLTSVISPFIVDPSSQVPSGLSPPRLGSMHCLR